MSSKKRVSGAIVRKSVLFDVSAKLTEMGFLMKVYWRNPNADIVAYRGRETKQIKVIKIKGKKPFPITDEEIERLDNLDSYLILAVVDDEGLRVQDFFVIPGHLLKSLISSGRKEIYSISPKNYEKFRGKWELLL